MAVVEREIRHVKDGAWRQDNASLRYAPGISKEELWAAHLVAKQLLIDYVNATTGAGLSSSVFTIGFARRATEWKRADLLFHDIGRLASIHERAGPIQLVFGGKAHPHDQSGKDLIRRPRPPQVGPGKVRDGTGHNEREHHNSDELQNDTGHKKCVQGCSADSGLLGRLLSHVRRGVV